MSNSKSREIRHTFLRTPIIHNRTLVKLCKIPTVWQLMQRCILSYCKTIYLTIFEREFHWEMSSQGSQRGRLNLSPSAMPSMMRPMKAVKPFSLKGSPTRKSPVCSPTPIAIGHRNSPERKSPISPSFKGEGIVSRQRFYSVLKTGTLPKLIVVLFYLDLKIYYTGLL